MIIVDIIYMGVKLMIENVVGSFVLLVGIIFFNFMGVGVIFIVFNVIDLFDFIVLVLGNIYSFIIDIQVNCEFLEGFGEFEFIFMYDLLCENSEDMEFLVLEEFMV